MYEHLSKEAATILWQRRKDGTQGHSLPDRCRPTTLEAGFAVQCAVSTLSNEHIAAWKCGMPSPGKWVVAPIYASTVYDQDVMRPCPVRARNGKLKIEPELAFTLKHDLPARDIAYAAEEVRDAIANARLALELIDTRYEPADSCNFHEHLADGLFNQGLLLGAEIDLTLALSASSIDIILKQSGAVILNTNGQHPAGDAALPLYWLAEFLRSQGMGLCAGQAVITGSYAGSPEVDIATIVDVEFGALGSIQVHFEEKE